MDEIDLVDLVDFVDRVDEVDGRKEIVESWKLKWGFTEGNGDGHGGFEESRGVCPEPWRFQGSLAVRWML